LLALALNLKRHKTLKGAIALLETVVTKANFVSKTLINR
jgi:hypothetical protein